ncbi:YqzL family protein [Paenibacillus sp. GCM10027626]|uniref:YqzL family protein n=1 Tax=Paenibacillus sp. GCM10027626 TaxID=3273411 RepID=UPI00362B1F69
MRDFSWKYFSLTGDVEAFMLYKAVKGESVLDTEMAADPSAETDEDSSDGDSALS